MADSKAWPKNRHKIYEMYTEVKAETHHVECFEYLTLVTCTITVHSESARFLFPVLLCKRNTSTERHLGAYDTVSSKERMSEHVHRATLAVGHADLTT